MASLPQHTTGTNNYVEVVPLTLHIGAEIRGVDLSKPLPAEQLKEVRDAFLKWQVVFFRGQNLDHARHDDPALWRRYVLDQSRCRLSGAVVDDARLCRRVARGPR